MASHYAYVAKSVHVVLRRRPYGWMWRLVDFLDVEIWRQDGYRTKALAKRAGQMARQRYLKKVEEYRAQLKAGDHPPFEPV